MISGITKFKNYHKGSDVYVLGSGASCNYIDPSFFDDKITIGTNQTYRKFKTNYIVRKEHSLVLETLNETNSNVIVGRYNAGNNPELNINGFTHDRLYYFDHRRLAGKYELDLTDFNKENHLVISYSTITTSMHFAYHLGARNIILVGVDHGTLDGKSTFDGYYKSIKETPWKDWGEYVSWLSKLEKDTRSMKSKLNELGVNVYSLNPFINFKLEEHDYKG